MDAGPVPCGVLFAQLTSGDPARIRSEAGCLSRAVRELHEAADGAAAIRLTGDWRGAAADAFCDRAARTRSAVGHSLEAVRLAAEGVAVAAELCAAVQAAARRVMTRTRLLSLLTGGVAGPLLYRQAAGELRALRDLYDQALTEQARIIDAVPVAFGEVRSRASSATTDTPAPPRMPNRSADPVAVARWWRSLSDHERDVLLVGAFDRLGGLAGLPAAVLDRANRRRLEADQVSPSASVRASAAAVDATLDAAARAAWRDGIGVDDIFLLAYTADGPGGDGTMVVAFGDPDTAAHVAITVPGTGSAVGTGFTDQAAALRAQMQATGHHSTIAWLGYDAPAWHDAFGSPRAAEAGAPRLVADVAGYRAAAAAAGSPRQHLTVIGHSYGGTVVGMAGVAGMAADDIVFVGSPGAGALHAVQFPAGQGHVWAGGNEHDPVIQTSDGTYFTGRKFPIGPYDRRFGAFQFETDSEQHLLQAHEAYFDRGSGSLRNLAHIATGRYGDVTERPALEAPIAPSAHALPVPTFDLRGKVLHEGRQIVGDLARGDLGEAARDLTDLGMTVVGEVTGTATGAAKAITEAWDVLG